MKVCSFKKKLEWISPKIRKLHALETTLEAREELTTIKKTSILLLCILSN